VTEAADLKAFDEFQGRVFVTALVLWMAALVISVAWSRGWSPVSGGIVIGGAASLGALRLKVWGLRRLAGNPTQRQARRLPVAGAARYLVLGAAFGLAAWLSAATGRDAYMVATGAALLLGNAAIVVQAARESPGRSH
jgi:hypothetical protein